VEAMSLDHEIISIWQSVRGGQCAYRSGAPSGQRVCRHPFSLTLKCALHDCPIALPKYVGFNRQETTIYMLEKDASRQFSEMWQERALSGDRSELEKLLESYPPGMRVNALKKFDGLQSIVAAIAEHLGEGEPSGEEKEEEIAR
jgi:hypothetical protein